VRSPGWVCANAQHPPCRNSLHNRCWAGPLPQPASNGQLEVSALPRQTRRPSSRAGSGSRATRREGSAFHFSDSLPGLADLLWASRTQLPGGSALAHQGLVNCRCQVAAGGLQHPTSGLCGDVRCSLSPFGRSLAASREEGEAAQLALAGPRRAIELVVPSAKVMQGAQSHFPGRSAHREY